MALNDTEKGQLREALHAINNALNSISMQAELAKMYAEQNDGENVREALDTIMSQCRVCSAATQSTRNLLIGSG